MRDRCRGCGRLLRTAESREREWGPKCDRANHPPARSPAAVKRPLPVSPSRLVRGGEPYPGQQEIELNREEMP